MGVIITHRIDTGVIVQVGVDKPRRWVSALAALMFLANSVLATFGVKGSAVS